MKKEGERLSIIVPNLMPLHKTTLRGNLLFLIFATIKRELLARRQKTFCWCPRCGFDLCFDSWSHTKKNGHEYYVCKKCGAGTEWDFDTFPIPVNVT